MLTLDYEHTEVKIIINYAKRCLARLLELIFLFAFSKAEISAGVFGSLE